MFKKIIPVALVALALASCDNGDYTDWVLPEQNAPVEAVQGALSATAASADLIDLNTVGETVKLINTTLPANATVESYKVRLSNADGAVYDVYADAEGNVKTEDLNNAIISLFNREVAPRELNATVSANVSVQGKEGTAVVAYSASSFTVKLQCIAPEYSEYLWTPGNGNGWSHSNSDLLWSPNADGIYTGFAYIDGGFKFTNAPDWDHTKYGGSLEAIDANGGDLSLEKGVYYFNVDLVHGTASATKIEYVSLIGEFNGWGGDTDMTWNEGAHCYEVSNAGVTANGWKFRFNHDWGLNLGGSTLDNLVPNGDNINVAGNTVKLYPFYRAGGVKPHCTVE